MKSLKEQLLIVLGLHVAGEDKEATIGGRQADIDHLNRCPPDDSGIAMDDR
jgi:hypothetical protein